MKIVLRQIDSAPVFCNERMRVSQLSAWFVELQARAAGQPNGRYSFVVERGGEFIKAGGAFAVLRKQAINGYVENAGRLAQANLRDRKTILADLDCCLREQQ